jgi:hypothetical protein
MCDFVLLFIITIISQNININVFNGFKKRVVVQIVVQMKKAATRKSIKTIL